MNSTLFVYWVLLQYKAYIYIIMHLPGQKLGNAEGYEWMRPGGVHIIIGLY